MTLHILSRDRWLYPPLWHYRVGRRRSVGGRRPGDRGTAVTCTTLEREPSCPSAIFVQATSSSAPLHRRQSPTTPRSARPSFRLLCDVCVRTVCRRVCVSSTFYQTGEIREKKKYTLTPAHYAIVTAAVVTILRLYIVHKARTLLFPHPNDPFFTAHITHTRRPWPFSARFDSKRRYCNNYAFERTAINILITFRSSRFVISRRRRRCRRRIYTNAPKPPPQQSSSSSLKNLPTKLGKYESGLVSISR